MQRLELQPLPSGVRLQLTQDRAISIATKSLAQIGGTNVVLYAADGLGLATYGQPLEPIWIVVVAVNSDPLPGNAACPPTQSCIPVWTQTTIAGAVVSDSSAKVTRMWDRGSAVSPPAQ